MRELIISKQMSLPLDAVTQTFAILAKKGSGKSYTAGVFQEEFAKNNVPFIVIDCMSAHWGIKEKFSVYVFGGRPQKDIPISPDLGKEVANTIVKNNISAILDVSEFSRTGQRKFVADFCNELYLINKTPKHVFIEESPEFAPQTVRSDHARVFNSVDTLVRLGRSKGIGVTLISQRSAKVNKDVLSQLDTLIILRTTWKADVDVLIDLMKNDVEKEELEAFSKDIQGLPNGCAYIWSPEWLQCFKRIQIRERETFHAGKTPELGEIPDVQLVEVDATKLAESFKKLIELKSEEKSVIRKLEREIERKDKQVEKLTNQIRKLNDKLDMLELVGKKLGMKPETVIEREAPKNFQEILDKKEIEIRKLKRNFEKIKTDFDNSVKVITDMGEKIRELENELNQYRTFRYELSKFLSVNIDDLMSRLDKVIDKKISERGASFRSEKIELISDKVLEKEYQKRVVRRILDNINSLSTRQRDIATWVNFIWRKQVTKSAIATKLLGWKSADQSVSNDINQLVEVGLIRKDAQGRLYPHIENLVKKELSSYEPSGEEIDDVIDSIKSKLAKEVINK